MADRTARVRLEAVTSTYIREMDKAHQATERLTGKVAGLDAAWGKADKGFKNIGGTMQNVGGHLTRYVTLPVTLAGGAAVKMATDFQTAFASMVGLAGVPQAEIEGLKDSVLELAGETGRAPKELADALYFAASAGLDAAGAMDAVEIAAKGAAVGMGSTEEIVGLVASAVASYGEENINAAQAVDILTATIREGRAEPSELAGTLGRVLPIASQLGVTFDEVGGAVAYLSNVFGDTNRTVTATQGLLVKLVSPSKQGRDTLEEMGTSVEELHAAIDQDGLLGALELLRTKGFDKNNQALRALFDDIEGYQAALALLNDNSGQLADIMGETADSAGALDNAFGTMAETAGFKNAQAFAQLQTALIQVGDILVPLITDVAEFAAALLGAFNDLPGPAQTAVVAFAGILAVTGPLVSIGGKLLTNWKTIGRGFDLAAGSAYDLAGKLSLAKTAAVGLAGIAVGAAINAWRSEMDEARSDAEEFVDSFSTLMDGDTFTRPVESMSDLHDEIMRVGSAAAELKRRGDEALNPFLKERLREAESGLNGTRDALLNVEAAAAELQAELGISADEAVRMATNTDVMTEALDPATGELDTNAAATAAQAAAAEEAADAQKAFEDSIKAVTSALRSQFDPFFAVTDAMLDNQDAQRKVQESHWKVTAAADKLAEAIKNEGKESWAAKNAAYELEQAQLDLDAANRDAARSVIDVAAATRELKTRIEEGNLSWEESHSQIEDWVAQGLLTEEQARQMKDEMGLAAVAARYLGEQDPTVRLRLEGYDAFMAAVAELDKVIGTPRVFNASIRAREYELPERRVGGPVYGALGEPVPIMAHGGEYVLSADVVRAIREGRPSAGLPALAPASGPASVSSVRGDTIINVTNGAVDSDRLLATAAWALAGR